MPAVNLNIPDKFREKLLDGTNTVDLEYAGTPAGAVMRCMIASALTINQNTAVTLGDATYTEVSGSNYTPVASGGGALANATVSLDGSGNVSVDAADPAVISQHASGFSDGRFALIVYDNGGAESTWPIVAYSADFGANKGNVDGDFSVTLNASGLLLSAR